MDSDPNTTIAMLIGEIRNIDAQLEALKAERDAKTTAIQTLMQANGETKTVTNAGTATAVTTRRINEKKFVAAFPPGQYPGLYQTKPNSSLVRKQLGDRQLEDAGCLTVSTSLRIK